LKFEESGTLVNGIKKSTLRLDLILEVCSLAFVFPRAAGYNYKV